MILKANGKDISSIVGNCTLESNIDTLGDQFNFEIAYSDMPYYLKAEVNIGDIIQLINDTKEVFRGIVIEKNRTEKTQTFSCFDFAFYLNKSKIIKQFNNIRADTAIKSLLTELGVSAGTIASMPVMIKKIYYDKEVSEVIKDIIQQVTDTTGVKYVMEMNEGKLTVYVDTDLIINLKVRLADNLPFSDISNTINGPSKKASIENMKNSIMLYTGGEDGIKVLYEERNYTFIKKYGLLQETQSVEDKDIAQAKNIAQNLLKDLSKVTIEGSVTVLGHFGLRAGRILQLNEPITNLVGNYKIKSVNHSIGTIHTASLELEGI